MYPVGDSYIELLESDHLDTETSEWIEKHGEGLFHICLDVGDIDEALAELKEKGILLRNETPLIGHGGARVAFLDPQSTENVVIELAELPTVPSY